MFFKSKTPKETILASENKKNKLRNKRSKLNQADPSYETKKNKINGKIHKENVKIEVAKLEMQQPVKNEITKNTNFNYNKTDNSKSVQFHGHYHSSGKKGKK